MDGRQGMDGKNGIKGAKGQSGIGIPGYKGNKGDRGMDGQTGKTGQPGLYYFIKFVLLYTLLCKLKYFFLAISFSFCITKSPTPKSIWYEYNTYTYMI